jgi:endonuclease YncB( thermonuclease family)
MVEQSRHLLIAVLSVVVLVGCSSTPEATPFPFTIEVGPFEPTLDPTHCSTRVCCSDCSSIPVDRVIDGDTFVSANATVRLFGVDTPERGQPCFTEATDRLRELVGGSVRGERGPRAGDNYGRILFYVYTENGESIDEILVREGLALAWTRDGQHRDVLVAAEEGARRDGRGCLWSNSR